MKSIFLLSSIALVLSSPENSPICDTSIAAASMRSKMGASARAPIVSLSVNQTSYKQRDFLTVTVTSDRAYNGILLYATSASDPTKRVGSFIVPNGFQNNAPVCTTSELTNSVITHTSGQNYSATRNFSYLTSSVYTGDLTFHLIIVQPESSGYSYAILDNAATLKFSGNASDSAAKRNDGKSHYNNGILWMAAAFIMTIFA